MSEDFFVVSGSRNYSVNFVQSIDELLNKLVAINDVVMVVDQSIQKFYPDFTKNLAAIAKIFFMTATEENKSLNGIERIVDFLQAQNATRTTTLVIIGGGIIQDTAVFAAHIYQRGLRVVLVPTTLLSMCDSCIGGKCGVNYQNYKNFLGAIHPPEAVFIWQGFLTSLSPAEIHSGYGEILKYALLSGSDFYQNLKTALYTDGFNNAETINYIYQGLQLKKQLVEEDEFDIGVRHLLNYGHTFGHALEGITNYILPHGVAVAFGIDMVNYLAWQRGILSEKIFFDVHALVEHYFKYDLSSLGLTSEILVKNAIKDKKATQGKNRLVFMEDIGKFRIDTVDFDHHIVKTLQSYLDNFR